MRKLILGASVLMSSLAIVGCAAKPEAASKANTTAAAAPAPDPSGKDIVHIVSRNRTVTVTSSSRGLLYSLKDADGRVQIADATERRFAELEPELYQNIKHYIAVQNDNTPVPSAGIDAAIPTAGFDAPIPTADVRHDGPSLTRQPRRFRGSTSGVGVDQFNQTADRPFPTAREDANR